MVARRQLLDLGLSRSAIEHRVRRGRLHPVRHRGRPWRGVYVVGRPELTQHGRLMAAALFAGPDALLSHETAAAAWGIRRGDQGDEIEVTVPLPGRHPAGLRVHRTASLLEEDRATLGGVPVTSPARTLIDLGRRLSNRALEAAINEADKLGLIDPETLRIVIEPRRGVQGAARLRAVLDRRTFRLTDSELERRFLRLVRRSGLPAPRTGVRLNGFKVDFHWPELGLIVETDGLRYHRTASQQARDRRRDQVQAAAGLTTLRFTHADVAFEEEHAVATLIAVSDRLRSDGGNLPS